MSDSRHIPCVIVPLYAAADSARRLLVSLGRTLPADTPVILVDDASGDALLADLLRPESLEALLPHQDVTLIQHPQNRGFAAAVNTGAAACDPADIVVINSDVVVPAGWFERLVDVASRCDRTATISCLANSGTMLSIPDRNGPRAEFPNGRSVDEVSDLVVAAVPPEPVEISNAIGHLMLISRAALDAVGGFDDAFYPGYGEEVDFSLRAAEAGFRNWVAPNVVVFHESEGSFGSDRAELVRRHSAIVEKRFPYVWARAREFELGESPTLAARLSAASSALRQPRIRLLGAPESLATDVRRRILEAGIAIHPPVDGIHDVVGDIDIVITGRTYPRLRCKAPSSRLVAIVERTDLISAPWLHDSTRHWQYWLEAVRDICATADRIITPHPHVLADWGIGEPQRTVQMPDPSVIFSRVPQPLDCDPDFLVGPMASRVFHAHVRDLQETRRGGRVVPTVAEVIPSILSGSLAEPTALDGEWRSLLTSFAGRISPQMITEHGATCEADDGATLQHWDPACRAASGAADDVLRIPRSALLAERGRAVEVILTELQAVLRQPVNPAAVFRPELCDERPKDDWDPGLGRPGSSRHKDITLSRRIHRRYPRIGRLMGDEETRRFQLARALYRKSRGM